jgi:cytochrome P450
MPAAIQFIGLWTRPLASLERCRARYGKRFTVRFPLAPPFVILSDPDEIKEVFRAPPDVLHPGEGARVLEPIVGKNWPSAKWRAGPVTGRSPLRRACSG